MEFFSTPSSHKKVIILDIPLVRFLYKTYAFECFLKYFNWLDEPYVHIYFDKT